MSSAKPRTVLALFVLFALVGTALIGLSPADSSAQNKKERLPKAELAKVQPKVGDISKHIRTQLNNARLNVEIAEPTFLKDALKTIGDAAKVPIRINDEAFRSIGIQDPDKAFVQLKKLNGVKLGTVLRLVLKQVKGDVYEGTFQVQDDHIEVTTTYHILLDGGSLPPNHPALKNEGGITPQELWSDWGRRYMWLVVWVEADKTPLAQALNEIAEDTPFTIVIDPRVAEQAKTPVSLSVNRAFFDTAVDLLVELTELDWLWRDNLVYVTSKENAKARRQAQRTREDDRVRMLREEATLYAANPERSIRIDGERTLDDAVREAARLGGFRVVFDSRLGDKVKTKIKPDLYDVPATTAVKLLADQADLRVVLIDSVYYVTSKENAKTLPEPVKEKAPVKP